MPCFCTFLMSETLFSSKNKESHKQKIFSKPAKTKHVTKYKRNNLKKRKFIYKLAIICQKCVTKIASLHQETEKVAKTAMSPKLKR